MSLLPLFLLGQLALVSAEGIDEGMPSVWMDPADGVFGVVVLESFQMIAHAALDRGLHDLVVDSLPVGRRHGVDDGEA